ncbi:cysteine desulfurase family protein [Parasphaerochaeta coccoides]|uniref:Cysteine desulfurase n=1 Tax=Parasphaerochaeta coccoides (strain ATCC BAA-1237 / DSM 17374 / SPN1) TaxID=760011 RepID=F4GJB3_PARC1|nr:cysteine desulfurase family protein [Parasphaerochaeta coccoides]AEC01753.1 Cysteine desulfurase [Parasphaerochaeta coccoides DSM 17374]
MSGQHGKHIYLLSRLHILTILRIIVAMTYPGYFDWAATSPMSESALEVYSRTARMFFGNPSSVHADGMQAKKMLAQFRASCARVLDVPPSTLYFTSGGTESNSIILGSLLWNKTPGKILIPWFEHPSVGRWEAILSEKGWDVIRLPAHGGYMAPEQLLHHIDADTRMVTCMLVNNIIGTVQDVAGIVRVVRDAEKKFGRKIHVHCDCVQAVGKTVFSLEQLGVDSATFSAHKFTGPRGIGLLYCSSPSVRALSRGGNQENGLRPGTENLPGIAAMTAALQETTDNLQMKIDKGAALRRDMEKILTEQAPRIIHISPSIDSTSPVTPFIMEISVSGIPSEVFTRRLSQEGFAVSAGSACSNNAKQESGVLEHMGMAAHDIDSPVRISFGHATEATDARKLAQTIAHLYASEASLLGYARKK